MLNGVGAWRALLGVLAVLAIALGGTACGSDDGDDGGGGATAAQGSGDSGDPKKQLEASYDEFIDYIYKGRWKQACARYSNAYVKVYPKQVRIASTCVKTMNGEYQNVSVQPRPWVDKVVFKGPTRAIGYTKVRADGNPSPIKFVREDGTWKLDGPAPQTQKQ